MNISIIGTGYVGLVTSACLAEKGHTVTCVDIQQERVDALNEGITPIFENGLDELIRKNVGQRLQATTDLAAAVQDTDLTFITVGTPFDGTAIDLGAVLGASRQIGQALRQKAGYHVVVVKSTVVPGTTDQRVLPELEASSGKRAGVDFGVGMNPEFLSEGQAVHDFMFPDRLVLGGIDQRTRDYLGDVYQMFVDTPRILTNTRTAELIKYTSNALLATLISFSNEVSNLAGAIQGIDTLDVMRGLHLSQYFHGQNKNALPTITSFLHPGCGFGGSCLPKDVKALIAHGKQAGQTMRLLEAVIAINDGQPTQLIQLLEQRWPKLQGIRVAVLGLAFKPETNDVRESPALPIIRKLLERGAQLKAFDPVANPEFRRALNDDRVHFCDSLTTAVDDVDAVIVVTPWEQFAALPEELRRRTPAPLLVDGRRAYAASDFTHYAGIGV